MNGASSNGPMRVATSDEFQACQAALVSTVPNVLQVKSVRIDTSTDFAEVVYLSDIGTTCVYMMTRKDYSKYLVNPYNSGAGTLPIQTGSGQYTISLPTGFDYYSSVVSPDLGKLYGIDDSMWISTPKEKAKCECGMHTTYGTNIAADQHSTWCKLYKKG